MTTDTEKAIAAREKRSRAAWAKRYPESNKAFDLDEYLDDEADEKPKAKPAAKKS